MANPTQPTPLTPPPIVLIRPYDGPTALQDQIRLAELLSKADVGITDQFRGDPGGILALMYRAIALDIPLMTAMDNLVFGNRGVCAMRARLMKALVTVRAGHRLIPVKVPDSATRAVARLEYSATDGREPFEAEWTLATAQAAGLTTKDKSPWRHYAPTMLWWRAMAKVVNLGCPEATMGIGCIEAGALDFTEEDETPESTVETIVVTDSTGRQVADQATRELLDEYATIGADGRPVVRDEITLDDLKDAWRKGVRSKDHPILARFAWSDGDTAYTMEQTLYDLLEQINARDAANTPDDKDPEQKPADLDTPPDTPATMTCGCDQATYTTTGQHREGCTKRRVRSRAGDAGPVATR